MGFDPNLIIFIFLYVLTIILVMVGIWFIFINKTKNTVGEYCDDSDDCASGLRCVGGNQCSPSENEISNLGESCDNNSQCILGNLCINNICSIPDSSGNSLFSSFT